ncbi:hypothetical protein F0562_032811 [Nyssa sinensis]|uniref:CCHC-type domain-containing protein n=1 Tax=Nyssa sinensis TaxID=561372 RepID=A0A5J5ARA9_9ASTE|nr:hypothetical protein F0562_032811 [Nyssa sinensis]
MNFNSLPSTPLLKLRSNSLPATMSLGNFSFKLFFIGYDLLGYIDGSKPCPSVTLMTNNSTTPNPAYPIWLKLCADELAILGAPIDEEDLTEKILDGLGDDYTELVRAVQACDNPISFYKLHEKLLTFEASLQGKTYESAYFPATANLTNKTNTHWRPQNTNTNWRPNPHGHTGWRSSLHSYTRPLMTSTSGTPPRDNCPPPRPYLGYCQICDIEGHKAKRCPSFKWVPIQPSNKDSTPSPST